MRSILEAVSLFCVACRNGEYRALPETLQVDPGDWDPSNYVMHSHDEQPLGSHACSTSESCLAISARAHGAALAVPRRPDSAHSLGSFTAAATAAAASGSNRSEAFQSSRQGLYVLPMQVGMCVTSSSLHLR